MENVLAEYMTIVLMNVNIRLVNFTSIPPFENTNYKIYGQILKAAKMKKENPCEKSTKMPEVEENFMQTWLDGKF